MKAKIPYLLVNRPQWNELKDSLTVHTQDMTFATSFVKEIENGNLDSTYPGDVKPDSLASSLLTMRDKMKLIAQDEKERNWSTEGLAKFAEILRTNDRSIDQLSNDIINELVNYLGANQGALYLINNQDSSDQFIEMIACYAYNRKKYLYKRIELGEGLIGQVVLEKETIFLTEIPDNYVKITSGLGDALPRNIIIVPLKLEEEIYGIVELASFNIIKPYQKAFLEKLSESLASTIANTKNSDHTKRLLTEMQIQAEQLRSQEEEMRQNMEELSTTQEDMHRVLKEAQSQEKYLKELINVPTDTIYTLDTNYKILSYNQAFGATLETMFGLNDLKGLCFLDIFPDRAEKKKQQDILDRVLVGEKFDLTTDYNHDGHILYFSTNYAPLRGEEGEIIGLAGFTKDVTAIITAQKQAEAALYESKQQAEEMRAQEEELRQNMEELSSTQEEMQRVLKEVQANEGYLTGILNVSVDSIFTLDEEFKIISCNHTFSKSLIEMGLNIGKGFCILDLFAHDEKVKKQNEEKYSRVFKGESFAENDRFEHGGIITYHYVTYSPLRNEKGEIFAAAIFAKDITEMYLAKELAENQKAYFIDIIEGMGDSILTVDRDFNIVIANNAFHEKFGKHGIETKTGANIMAAIKPEEQEAFKRPYLQALEGKSVEIADRKLFGRDLHVFYNPLRNSLGEVVGVGLIAHDVTEQKDLQRSTEKLLQESQQQSEALRAQEEEMRQNMEEMQSIQEELAIKNEEMEKVRMVERERADMQIQSQKKNLQSIVSKFKELESQYKNRIKELERKLKTAA